MRLVQTRGFSTYAYTPLIFPFPPSDGGRVAMPWWPLLGIMIHSRVPASLASLTLDVHHVGGSCAGAEGGAVPRRPLSGDGVPGQGTSYPYQRPYVAHVAWCWLQWGSLDYDECTWEFRR